MQEWVNEFELAAIVLMAVLLILHISEKRIYTKLSYFYIVILVSSLLTAIADEAAIYTLAHFEDVPLWVNYFTNALYSIMSNCMYMLYMIYAIYATRMENTIRPVARFLLMIPGILIITMVLTTSNTGWAFTIENGVYTQGVGFYFMYAGAVGYVLLATVLACINRRQLSRLQFMSIVYFAVALTVCAVVMVLYPKYLLNAFATVIGLIMVYLSMESSLVDSDKNLDTYNGNALGKQVERSLREGRKFYLVALRVGNYEKLSASMGYENVDHILAQVAEHLLMVTPHKKVFHLNSVQFVMYIEDEPKKVAGIVSDIEDRFARNFRLKNLKNEVVLPFSMVVAHVPEQGSNPEEIGGLLEYAFENDKNSDLHPTVWIDDSLIKDYRRHMLVEKALDKAIRNGGFEVHYQPVWDTGKNAFTMVEALVRIRDESDELIGPKEFVPIAENNGSILQVSDFVLNKVCEFTAANRLWEKGIEYVQINLSHYECALPNLPDRIMSAINRYELNPVLISIDITENTSRAAFDGMILDNMKALSYYGVAFALDDYGVGYSNITELAGLPFNTVKIDRSILWMAHNSQSTKSILTNTVAMLRDMKFKILVEGVETEEQAGKLKDMGCSYLQGYYYSRPLRGEELVGLLTGKKKRI